MFEPTRFALFLAASWALIIAPGPDMLYVITRGIAHGRKAGVLSALGVVSGILVHTVAAALGLTLIFQTSGTAFLIIKYVGALYLVYLGIRSWRDKSAFDIHIETIPKRSLILFGQGMLSNILNPKIAIFFLAFLPQFVDEAYGNVTVQMIVLGIIFAIFGLCFLFTVGYSAGAFRSWLTQKPRFTNFLRQLASGILVGLGVRLALAKR